MDFHSSYAVSERDYGDMDYNYNQKALPVKGKKS